MKKTLTISLFFLLSVSYLFSQNDTIYYKRFFNVGVIPTMSTNGKKTEFCENNISLSLLWGSSHNNHGFVLSGLGAYTRNNAYGIQIGGLLNRIGYDPNRWGIWPSDLTSGNYQGGWGGGLAIAGIGNTAYAYDGMQIAFANRTAILRGVQLGAMNGAEISGQGLQLGFFNSGGNISGLQFGMVNMGDTVKGLQLGVVNEARGRSGLQMGMINMSPHNDWPIGLINIIGDGTMHASLSVDEIASTVVTFRSGGRHLYGVAGMGVNFKSRNLHAVIEGGIGAHIHLSNRFRIDNEIVANVLSIPEFNADPDPDVKSDHDFRPLYKFSYRMLAAFRCSDKIEIFAGPTVNFMQTHTLSNEHIFPSHHFWRNFGSRTLKQAYFGGVVGVSYVIK